MLPSLWVRQSEPKEKTLHPKSAGDKRIQRIQGLWGKKTGGEYLPKNAAGVQHTRNGQELKKAGERKKGGQWKDEERKEGIGKREPERK